MTFALCTQEIKKHGILRVAVIGEEKSVVAIYKKAFNTNGN